MTDELAHPHRKPPNVRCAYCHDAAAGAVETCAGCGTILHSECLALAGACPTLGCRVSVRAAASTSAEEPRPARYHRLLFRGAAVLLTLPQLLGLALGSLVQPSWYFPRPFVTFVPLLCACVPLSVLLGPLLFWALETPFPVPDRVHMRIPRRTWIAVPLVTALGAWHVLQGIPYWVQWDGHGELALPVMLINISLIGLIWLLFAFARNRPDPGKILALHWVFVLWLVWQAFPCLGELI